MSGDAKTFGRAKREPGDPVRSEAIELLACLANEHTGHVTISLPGGWHIEARKLARRVVVAVDTDIPRRMRYAEAEARLREGSYG